MEPLRNAFGLSKSASIFNRFDFKNNLCPGLVKASSWPKFRIILRCGSHGFLKAILILTALEVNIDLNCLTNILLVDNFVMLQKTPESTMQNPVIINTDLFFNL